MNLDAPSRIQVTFCTFAVLCCWFEMPVACSCSLPVPNLVSQKRGRLNSCRSAPCHAATCCAVPLCRSNFKDELEDRTTPDHEAEGIK